MKFKSSLRKMFAVRQHDEAICLLRRTNELMAPSQTDCFVSLRFACLPRNDC
jgi:hypothetical protein